MRNLFLEDRHQNKCRDNGVSTSLESTEYFIPLRKHFLVLLISTFQSASYNLASRHSSQLMNNRSCYLLDLFTLDRHFAERGNIALCFTGDTNILWDRGKRGMMIILSVWVSSILFKGSSGVINFVHMYLAVQHFVHKII